MATAAAKRAALLHERERGKLERIGVRAAGGVARELRVDVLRAFSSGRDVVPVIRAALDRSFQPLIIQTMTAAHLQGRLRSARTAAVALKKRKGMGAYDDALDYLARRLALGPEQIEQVAATYGNEAANVTRNMSAAVEQRVQQTISEINAQGYHVRKGTAMLRESMERAGVSTVKPHLMEALVRTQTQMAYSAGRWNGNRDPAIQSILWGYEYSAVGDDRTRPTHEGLDGTRLPKDDPRWGEIWPINGFACRCTTIEIFVGDEEATLKEPPAEFEDPVTGRKVRPGADKGWAFNPGTTFSDQLPPTSAKPGPKPKPAPRPKAKPKPKPPSVPVVREAKVGEKFNIPKHASVTHSEKRAIEQYTGFAHRELNETLRAGTKLGKEQKAMASGLDSALKKLPKYEGKTYRELRFWETKTRNKFIADHKVGDAISYHQYVSTTRTRGTYAGLRNIPDKERVSMVIQSKNGRVVEHLSTYGTSSGDKNEREILFGRKASFVVESKKLRSNGSWHVVLREVNRVT